MKSDQIVNIIVAAVVMLVSGGVLALLLSIADRYLQVQVDPRISEVISMLPGYNCGACGSSGCSGHATDLVEGKVTKFACTPAKPDAKQKIKDYLASTPDAEGKTINIQI